MPIPQFDDNGNLPVGEHAATWIEFKDRYGTNRGRRAILAKIESWLLHMRDANCRTVFVDGSFICAKKVPGDYDACFDATGVNLNILDPCLLDQSPEGRKAIKERFGGDIRPDMVAIAGSILTYLRFFQRDRDGNPKGIVRFNLKELDL